MNFLLESNRNYFQTLRLLKCEVCKDQVASVKRSCSWTVSNSGCCCVIDTWPSKPTERKYLCTPKPTERNGPCTPKPREEGPVYPKTHRGRTCAPQNSTVGCFSMGLSVMEMHVTWKFSLKCQYHEGISSRAFSAILLFTPLKLFFEFWTLPPFPLSSFPWSMTFLFLGKDHWLYIFPLTSQLITYKVFPNLKENHSKSNQTNEI